MLINIFGDVKRMWADYNAEILVGFILNSLAERCAGRSLGPFSIDVKKVCRDTPTFCATSPVE